MDNRTEDNLEPEWDAPGTDDRDSDQDARLAFEKGMKRFAEGATALTAASIRMQMLMLEQAQEIMGEISAAFGDLDNDGKTDC